MKSKQSISTVQTNVGGAQAFTIAATGKAFKTLIDGLYSDKILAPVRELATNAWDAHVAAGNSDQPFDIHVPTPEVPEFGVRDYGVGMDHQTVTGLYTTLFQSSKDESNEQAGMLGLGSKSPFAYTDAFSVMAYDGTTKRVYAAFLQENVPQLALLTEEPSTEPCGIDVRFPVEPHDIGDFKMAVHKVTMGFDVQPNHVGAQAVLDRPVKHDGEWWRIYSVDTYAHDEFLSGFNIRQGCVIYPAQREAVRRSKWGQHTLSHNLAFVIDVPIGTSDVATSREALAGDPESLEGVTSFLDAAYEEYKVTVLDQVTQAKTQLERAKAISLVDYEWRRVFNLPQVPVVHLLKDLPNHKHDKMRLRPGYVLPTAKGRQNQWEFRFDILDRMQIVLDDKVTIRRRSRIRDWQRNRSYCYYLAPEGQEQAVKRIKTVLGLRDDQFIPVDELADPGPPQRGVGGSRSRGKLSDIREMLDAGAFWAQRMRLVATLPSYEEGGVTDCYVDTAALCMDPVVQFLVHGDRTQRGVAETAAKIVWLTDSQYEKMADELDESHNLGRAVRRYADLHLRHLHRHHMIEDQFISQLTRQLDYSARFIFMEEMGFNRFRPDPDGLQTVNLVYGRGTVQRLGADVDEIDSLARQRVNDLKKRYPMCFPVDKGAIREYIRTQRAASPISTDNNNNNNNQENNQS